MTSHSSQGQTAERVLVHVDTELGAKNLTVVFAALLREGCLTEDDLRGLAQDKLDAIRRTARS